MTATASESNPPELRAAPSRLPLRLALLCDYPEEAWLSMDLVGEMIRHHLEREHADVIRPTRIIPSFRRRASRLIPQRWAWTARNTDRLLNRFWDYPRDLRRRLRFEAFDLFHLVDHSYAQLFHVLPTERTVVTCHDLDTFRCLLKPASEPRPAWFRKMARHILQGLQKASAVACDSEATRQAILRYGLLPEDRLHVVYLAVHPECRPEPDPEADAEAARLLGLDNRQNGDDEPPLILHVGSNIPRKRIDILLEVFARIRREVPEARLVKAGGALQGPLARQAEDLGILNAIQILPFFSPTNSRDRAILAAIYRRVALVLQPSEAEGFGLPVAEAQACGAVVLASDLDVLREIGGQAAVYRPVADLSSWTEAALDLLSQRQARSETWQALRTSGLIQSARFRWTTHVAQLVKIYTTLSGF